MITVAVYVGSVRREKSINRRLAKAIEKLAEGRMTFLWPDLAALPFYDADLEADAPAAATALRDATRAADAVLFVTPEHNRFPPAVLVNATEWASRPYGKGVLRGKPAAIVGTSPGAIGTAAAQAAFRSLAAALGTVLMIHPEVYFQTKPGLIADDFSVTDEAADKFLRDWVDAFAAFVERTRVTETKLAAE